jgi:hypothetical protein
LASSSSFVSCFVDYNESFFNLADAITHRQRTSRRARCLAGAIESTARFCLFVQSQYVSFSHVVFDLIRFWLSSFVRSFFFLGADKTRRRVVAMLLTDGVHVLPVVPVPDNYR